MHSDCSLENIACVLLAQTKDAKIVCVIRCQITFMTRMHTSLKRLASARHSNSKKIVFTFSIVDCTLQTKQSLKTKKRMTYFPGAPLYCGRAGSDVIGCRRPTGGVFVCMLQTRVTLTAFPIATPRGRSSKFPRKGTTYYFHSNTKQGTHEYSWIFPSNVTKSLRPNISEQRVSHRFIEWS